jgi:uncharacterized membrane protein YtjA (UPF0391 family)
VNACLWEPDGTAHAYLGQRLRFSERGTIMLKWALIFLVVSLIAGALGFSGVAAGAARISKILFGIFFAIFLVILIFALLAGQALF